MLDGRRSSWPGRCWAPRCPSHGRKRYRIATGFEGWRRGQVLWAARSVHKPILKVAFGSTPVICAPEPSALGICRVIGPWALTQADRMERLAEPALRLPLALCRRFQAPYRQLPRPIPSAIAICVTVRPSFKSFTASSRQASCRSRPQVRGNSRAKFEAILAGYSQFGGSNRVHLNETRYSTVQ
jgi:hypothetical protein